MSGSITLHGRLGVNPRMTTCGICGEAAGILLLGQSNYHDTCCDCKARVYGGISPTHRCPKCGSFNGHSRTYLEDHESRLPILGTCGNCREKQKTKVALILVDGKPPQFKGERLGPVVFITNEEFKSTFNGPPVEAALKKRSVFVPMEVWLKIGLPSIEECKRRAEEDK